MNVQSKVNVTGAILVTAPITTVYCQFCDLQIFNW